VDFATSRSPRAVRVPHFTIARYCMMLRVLASRGRHRLFSFNLTNRTRPANLVIENSIRAFLTMWSWESVQDATRTWCWLIFEVHSKSKMIRRGWVSNTNGWTRPATDHAISPGGGSGEPRLKPTPVGPAKATGHIALQTCRCRCGWARLLLMIWIRRKWKGGQR